MVKNRFFKLWPWVLAWFVLALLCTFVRLYPLRAHLWDDARDQATLFVVYNIKQTFLKQILSMFVIMFNLLFCIF